MAWNSRLTLQDNLLFSCCCARVDFSWSTVCDCYAGGYKCEQTCLETALVEESVYATVGTNLYNNVTYMYPNANIWLTGHSVSCPFEGLKLTRYQLGGSLSALIALAFGAPAVGFEAPGDRLPARRLHLPQPPALPAHLSGITHVYHTADPIPMGACTGTYSGCYAAGFALESKCHTGQTILYDTVTVKGWSVDVRTHRISEVIGKVLADPWPTGDDPNAPHDPPSKDPKDPKKPKDPKEPDEPDDEPWNWSASMSLSPRWSALLNLGLGNWWEWPLPGRRGPRPGDDDGDDDDDGSFPSGGGKGDWEKHGGVPKAVAELDCVDCFKWEFGDNWKDKETE
jgi:lipase ATG15